MYKLNLFFRHGDLENGEICFLKDLPFHDFINGEPTMHLLDLI